MVILFTSVLGNVFIASISTFRNFFLTEYQKISIVVLYSCELIAVVSFHTSTSTSRAASVRLKNVCAPVSSSSTHADP